MELADRRDDPRLPLERDDRLHPDAAKRLPDEGCELRMLADTPLDQVRTRVRPGVAGPERRVLPRGSDEPLRIVDVAVEGQEPVGVAGLSPAEDQYLVPLGAFDGLEDELLDPGSREPVPEVPRVPEATAVERAAVDRVVDPVNLRERESQRAEKNG